MKFRWSKGVIVVFTLRTRPFSSPLAKVGIEPIARNQTKISVNVLLIMVIAGVIAAIGLATNALPKRDQRFAAALRDRAQAYC